MDNWSTERLKGRDERIVFQNGVCIDNRSLSLPRSPAVPLLAWRCYVSGAGSVALCCIENAM